MADRPDRAPQPVSGTDPATGGQPDDLHARLTELRRTEQDLLQSLAPDHDDRPPDDQPARAAPASAAALGRRVGRQVQEAAAARQRLAELARAIADVEDQVAGVLEGLAATGSPDQAAHRLELAQRARDHAVAERERAAEYDEPEQPR